MCNFYLYYRYPKQGELKKLKSFEKIYVHMNYDLLLLLNLIFKLKDNFQY